MMQLPAPLARAFEDKVTITVGELCALLPIDRKTLYRHISAGHIAWVQLGMGDRAVRRGFTLKAITQFLEDRGRIMSPPEPRRMRRSGPEAEGILVLLARRDSTKTRSSTAPDSNDFLAQRAARKATLKQRLRITSRNEER